MNVFQENILIGSILGDGNLALYGRSKNAFYREHGNEKQNEYRSWKAERLHINFVKDHNKIYYKSLPLYTHYHKLFYIDKVKTITSENIKLLNHQKV